jgi:hypothetical protein
LRIGENGVKEDLMVSFDVNKLFLEICQIQHITPTIFINEKPPKIDTQCVSEGLEKPSTLFHHTHLIP